MALLLLSCNPSPFFLSLQIFFCFCFCFLLHQQCLIVCLSLRSGFRLVILPYRPDWCSAVEMVVLLKGYPISTEQRWSSVRVIIGFLVSSLTKAFLSQYLRLARQSDGFRLLPFMDDGGHYAHWNL